MDHALSHRDQSHKTPRSIGFRWSRQMVADGSRSRRWLWPRRSYGPRAGDPPRGGISFGLVSFGQAGRILNRTQLLVLGFFVLVWIALVAILAFSPDVYAHALSLAPGDIRMIEVGFLVALSALIALLVIGVLRRWRWAFWLILVAFLFGVLRLPASALQLVGLMSATGPIWYEALQGAIGVAQFLIALAMLSGYKKAGVWGAF